MSPRPPSYVLGLAACLAAYVGCGDDDAPPPDASPSELCEANSECDDGRFCNGAERCDPDDDGADEIGCVDGELPCPGLMCDEETDMCTDECIDGDGDGALPMNCGGDDCDDNDAERFPGNTEVCDAEGVDEDCDPSTIGDDDDGDGYIDSNCCQQIGARLSCGRDCDDTTQDVNPEIVDVCGNGDEDCDGDVDEDPNMTFFRDADGDGFGIPSDTILACAAGNGYVLRNTDCNDDLPGVNPDATELCELAMTDEDCDGAVNEGCDCDSMGASRMCTGSSEGQCRPGTQECLASGGGFAWGPCIDRVEPMAEICDGLDNDCDMIVDNNPAFTCRPGQMEIGDNACGQSNCTRQCNDDTCQWTTTDFSCPETAGTCNYCDDTGRGLAEEIGFANETHTFTFVRESGATFLGDASERSDCGRLRNSRCTVIAQQSTDLMLPVGGAFIAAPRPIGYGGITIEAAINHEFGSPARGNGYAWVVIAGGAGLGNGSDDLGVPRNRRGFAIETRPTPEAESLTLTLRALRESAGPVVLTSQTLLRETVPERLEIVVIPDRPDTETNETSVQIRERLASGWSAPIGCSGDACMATLELGELATAGITAASEAGRDDSYSFSNGLGQDIPTVTFNQLCP